MWLGHHRTICPPRLFALYVTGYSAFRIFEETLQIHSSEHFLGLRLNFCTAPERPAGVESTAMTNAVAKATTSVQPVPSTRSR